MTTDKQSANNPVFERRESEARSYCRGFPTTFAKAQGSIMTATDGTEYIDFLAGCSSLNYGHNDADMKAALVEHITNDGIAHGLDMYTEEKAKWLEAYENIVLKPRGMDDYKVMMTGPTGTNAVEAAMKLARKITGRRNIISFTNGFHGMTMGSLSLTGNAGKRGGAGTPLGGVTHMPYEGAMGEGVDTLAFIETMLDNGSSGVDAPAAFIFEPVQGEGGLNAASKEWMEGIAKLAKKHGALLIAEDQPVIWRGPMLMSAVTQFLKDVAWGTLDYLVIDLPPGTGDAQLSVSQVVSISGAVIVTTPQDLALLDAKKGIGMFEKVNIPVLGVVENMAIHICSNCGHAEHLFGEGGGERLAAQYNVELLGSMPLSMMIREQADGGKPTVVAEPECQISMVYQDMARHAAARITALNGAGDMPEISISED